MIKKMKNQKEFFSTLQLAGSIILLACSVLLVGYYILFPSRGYFHSDTTDTIMWAEASYDAGKLFNQDFSYACLLPFGTSLIMTALIPITGVSMTTHVLGMLIFFLIFTGSLILMLRQMGWKWGWISIAVFFELMTCSGSEKLREIFWGHTIYYSLGVCFLFIGLGLLFRQMNLKKQLEKAPEQQQKNLKIHFICCTAGMSIFFLLAGMNQISAITIFSLPMIGAVFCERWFDTKTKLLSVQNLHAVILIALMGVATVGGYFLTKGLSHGITADYAESYSTYTSMSEWEGHLRLFPAAYLSLIGVEISAKDAMMSGKSVIALLTIITGALMQILPIIALFFWKRIKDAKLKILLLAYWFMTLLIMMGYIFGLLSAANWRLSPIAAMSAVVSIAFLRWAFSHTEWQRFAVLLLVPAMIVSTIHAVNLLKMPADNTARSDLYMLTEELESRNLSYGYATFWRANALTIISDSKVKCRMIEPCDSGFYIKKYQINKHWYEDQPNQEEYFVLLSLQEANDLRQIQENLSPEQIETIENQNDYAILSRSHSEIPVGNYEIWVFNKNIF